jgi:HEAT repeat protein
LGPNAVEAAPALVRAFGDKDEKVRYLVACAAAAIGEGAVPALIDALKSGDSVTKVDAAWVLQEIGPDAVVPILVKDLEKGDTEAELERLHAREVRFHQGVKPEVIFAEEMKEKKNTNLNNADILMIFDTDVLPVLITTLQDKNPYARELAAKTACSIAQGLKFRPLANPWDPWFQDTQQDIADDVDQITNCPGLITALIEALTDDYCCVRYLAAEAFHHIGPVDERILPALAVCMNDANSYVRQEAAAAIGCMGPGAVPILIEALDDTDEYVRGSVVSALFTQGADAAPALPKLREMANNDPVEWIRKFTGNIVLNIESIIASAPSPGSIF